MQELTSGISLIFGFLIMDKSKQNQEVLRLTWWLEWFIRMVLGWCFAAIGVNGSKY